MTFLDLFRLYYVMENFRFFFSFVCCFMYMSFVCPHSLKKKNCQMPIYVHLYMIPNIPVVIFKYHLSSHWVSLVAQMVKHLPAMLETRVWSLGWEDLLEKEVATHSSTLAWRIPWLEDSGRLQSCLTLCDPMNHRTPGLPVHHQLPEFTQTHAHRVGDAIQQFHPLSSPSPAALNPSQHQGLFQWVNSSHEIDKVLEFQLQHQSFQWIPGLISFRIDWLDLLAIQGTLKSLLQNHSSKASILQCSAFFIVQLSHPYMTTGKTIALTIQTFVGKVMSLLFNMLSRLVITLFQGVSVF